MRRLLSFIALILVSASATAAPAEVRSRAAQILTHAVNTPCQAAGAKGKDWAEYLGQATMISEKIDKFMRFPVRLVRTFQIKTGDQVRIIAIVPGGQLQRVVVEFHQANSKSGFRPVMLGLANGKCGLTVGRYIEYDGTGQAVRLFPLDADFKDSGPAQPLDAPLPPGSDPGGVKVAIVDSGVNYTLPMIANRLARGADGKPLGYDFWDMDDRPFDVDASNSIFFPARHGTRIASVLLREAPGVRLIPYRYPRPDMSRMADLVADADAKGVLIVGMPMGSGRTSDWTAFVKAASSRPHMLFIVSAGNNGRNIDKRPVFPASFKLDNMLVVTSSTDNGRVGPGANWGAGHVDLMVPAENIPVIDHLGAETKGSGSSFAVSRLAALAARLLARNPQWRAAELKKAIIGRAQPSAEKSNTRVRHGWIPDPQKDG